MIARLAATAALLVALSGVACGRGLEGELVDEPVLDWSFAVAATDVAFATADGATPGFLAVRHFVHEGALHLYVMDVLGDDPEWIQRLRADPAIRVRIGGRVYPGSAVPVTEPATIEALLPALLRQVHRVEATGARWDPAPARYPGTQVRQWFFRMESEG